MSRMTKDLLISLAFGAVGGILGGITGAFMLGVV